MTKIKLTKIEPGFYRVAGTDLYVRKDMTTRKQWGGGDEWDIITPDPSEDDKSLPLIKQQMMILITANSKAHCVARLEKMAAELGKLA